MRELAWCKSRAALVVAVMAWLGAVTSGFAIFQRYESTPGSSGAPTVDWPADASIPLERHGLTLVLAIHPHCPCSASTVHELERVLASRPGRAMLNVLLFKPASAPDSWASSSTSRTLANMADSKIWLDAGGRKAARFGTVTSGELLVYDAGGRLRFAGGITPLRGQNGANAGSESLEALLDDSRTELRHTPVFGCSLITAPATPEGDH